MAIIDVRRKSMLDKIGNQGSISPIDPYLMDLSTEQEATSEPKSTDLQNQDEDDDTTNWLKKLRKLYDPETEATKRFAQLLDAHPERQEPSFMRRLVASGATLGNKRRGIPGGIGQADKVLEEPYKQDLEDWKSKADQFSKAAQYENTANTNERNLTANLINAKTQADRIAASEKKVREETASKERIAAGKNALVAEKLRGTEFVVTPSGKIYAKKLDGTFYDTGEDAKNYTPIEIANITAASRKEVANINATSRENVAETGAESRGNVAETRGWVIGEINDPNNPGQKINVRMNQITGETQPLTVGDKPVTGATKLGTPPKVAPGQPNNIQDIQNSTRETLNVLNELLGDDDKLKPEAMSAVGKSRMLGLQHVPATQTRATDAKIKRLKNRITIGLIAEMKAQSKTGATGFGQMNMRELDVLEQAASSLDPTLGEEAFAAELKRIREKLQKILQPADGLNPTVTSKPTAADLLKKYGGEP